MSGLVTFPQQDLFICLIGIPLIHAPGRSVCGVRKSFPSNYPAASIYSRAALLLFSDGLAFYLPPAAAHQIKWGQITKNQRCTRVSYLTVIEKKPGINHPKQQLSIIDQKMKYLWSNWIVPGSYQIPSLSDGRFFGENNEAKFYLYLCSIVKLRRRFSLENI